MAPELIKKGRYYGKSVDVWALGVVLFKMLTGTYPFGNPKDPSLKSNICIGRLRVPSYVSRLAKDLLLQVLRVNHK